MPEFYVEVAPAKPEPPMVYNVIAPTDADGDPDGAPPQAKAAATRTAKALSTDADPGAADKEK
jgi:hypothetical protein